MNFNELKNNRGAALKALQKELDEASSPKKKDQWKDDRFWQPTVDKVGNGGAVIRFLPSPSGDAPFVKVWSHGFRGPTGQWYIENSLTTIGEKDPVGELNNKLWNAGNEDQARDQKRRLHFISNVLVLKDPADSENNGKVFLFKYGKKIFEKIENAIRPPFDDEGRTPDDDNYDPVNAIDPFDMWEGANFRILIRKHEGFRNYDLSKFDAASAIAKSDARLKEVFDELYDIQEFVNPENFKSYNELKARLHKVLGIDDEWSAAEEQKEKKSSKKDDSLEENDEISSSDEVDDDFDLDKLMEEVT